MSTSYLRGNPTRYDPGIGKWLYIEDDTPANDSKPCTRCKQFPTEKGYDACLGHIEGVISACCGHGVKGLIFMREGDRNKWLPLKT